MQVNKNGAIELSKAPPYKGLRPSANYLFNTMARLWHGRLGIILTGMGDDGLKRMESLFNAALIIAQNEESCIVYGMPAES
jgi:two-component system chemotaxis response regulator CheB